MECELGLHWATDKSLGVAQGSENNSTLVGAKLGHDMLSWGCTGLLASDWGWHRVQKMMALQLGPNWNMACDLGLHWAIGK